MRIIPSRPAVRTLAALALLLALPPALRAQEPPPEFDGYRLPGVTFTPGVSVGTVWDSNVALAGAGAGRLETAADGIWVIEPSGRLELFSSRTELVAGYRGHMRRYFDVSQLNGFDQRGYLSFRRRATRRLTFHLRNEFVDVPTTDEVALNSGLPFTRVGSRSNRFSAGIEARLTKYTDLKVRYENTWIAFDRDEEFLSNGWINGGRADVTRRLSERASFGAEYGLRRAELDEGTRVMWFQDLGALFSYAAGPHTRLSLAGGYSILSDERLPDGRHGPYVRAGVTHETARATFGASFERSFVPTFGFGGSSDSQELRGFVHVPFSRNRLYVSSGAAWRRTEPLLLQNLEVDTIRTNNTFGYAVTRVLRLEAFHVFTRQDSRITGGEVNRQRAGVQVVVSQPMRIR